MFVVFKGSRGRSFAQTQVAHGGRFVLRRKRCWRNQTNGGKYKHKQQAEKYKNIRSLRQTEAFEWLIVCRCAGGRRGAQRRGLGWRKPKMLWSLCRRDWRSPSYPAPHQDPLRSTTPHHGPNGTRQSRWDDIAVLPVRYLTWILNISFWRHRCCVFNWIHLIGLDLQGRFDALLALLRRQYDRVALMRPTSQDKVRNICSIFLQRL